MATVFIESDVHWFLLRVVVCGVGFWQVCVYRDLLVGLMAKWLYCLQLFCVTCFNCCHVGGDLVLCHGHTILCQSVSTFSVSEIPVSWYSQQCS